MKISISRRIFIVDWNCFRFFSRCDNEIWTRKQRVWRGEKRRSWAVWTNRWSGGPVGRWADRRPIPWWSRPAVATRTPCRLTVLHTNCIECRCFFMFIVQSNSVITNFLAPRVHFCAKYVVSNLLFLAEPTDFGGRRRYRYNQCWLLTCVFSNLYYWLKKFAGCCSVKPIWVLLAYGSTLFHFLVL